ncbi:MAG: helix-turn-helix domain-containing protein [Actinomyces bowdenii]|nr:helix-turn-helix domain-containing protein [Actinomyces bowdenii]
MAISDDSSQGCQQAHGDVYSADCPCRDLLDAVANKWSALAIGALEGGPLRFGELQRRLQGISPKVLTATLRRLEGHGLVHREVIPAVPLHVEYSLTDAGRSAVEPVFMLRQWAESQYALARARADRPGPGDELHFPSVSKGACG